MGDIMLNPGQNLPIRKACKTNGQQNEELSVGLDFHLKFLP